MIERSRQIKLWHCPSTVNIYVGLTKLYFVIENFLNLLILEIEIISLKVRVTTFDLLLVVIKCLFQNILVSVAEFRDVGDGRITNYKVSGILWGRWVRYRVSGGFFENYIVWFTSLVLRYLVCSGFTIKQILYPNFLPEIQLLLPLASPSPKLEL